MIKLLCTDFDGTIFEEGGNPVISHRFLDLVRRLQQRGMKWIVSTGRDVDEVVSTLRFHGITETMPDYMSVVERKIYKREGDVYRSVEPWNAVCMETHRKLFHKIAPRVEEIREWIKKDYGSSILYEDKYSPLCLICPDNGEADHVLAKVSAALENISELSIVRNDVYSRLAHCNYNKGATLLELEKMLGISPEEVVVAGDHYNDLTMLNPTLSKHLITPRNALNKVREHIRQVGGWVSELCYADGVADGLEHFIKK